MWIRHSRSAKFLSIFKVGYSVLLFKTAADKSPDLIQQARKNNQVSVAGVDDMTVMAVKSLSILDFGFEISDLSEKNLLKSQIHNPKSQMP